MPELPELPELPRARVARFPLPQGAKQMGNGKKGNSFDYDIQNHSPIGKSIIQPEKNTVEQGFETKVLQPYITPY